LVQYRCKFCSHIERVGIGRQVLEFTDVESAPSGW
jgi:hypothetical protein